MATVYGIVKQSNGFIWTYSEEGEGTTFKIYLPSVDEMVIKEKMPQQDSSRFGGSETILVVEDEKELRKLVCETLSNFGYNILQASDGEKAITICKNYKNPIHLILTDVVMPRMNGKQFIDKITHHYPDTKVIFMSGYTDNAITHQGILNPGTNYIQKPFTPLILLQRVREILDDKTI